MICVYVNEWAKFRVSRELLLAMLEDFRKVGGTTLRVVQGVKGMPFDFSEN